MPRLKYVANLDRLGMGESERFGGKNASLGEMIGRLSKAGIRVPGGFASSADAYRELTGGDDGVSVAVRSSATAEDLPDASFAGQQETFLNIRGLPNVMAALKRVFA